MGYQGILDAGGWWVIRNALITFWHILSFPFSLIASKASIVHICTSGFWVFWESVAYGVIARILHRRTILHIHTDFPGFYSASGPKERWLMGWGLKVMDRVIVLTESAAAIVRGLVASDKVCVIPTSIRKSDIPDTSTYQKKSDGVTVLFMGGNYAKRKGIDQLVQAIPKVVEKCVCRFVISGVGDAEQAYQHLCGSGYENIIEYVGWVSEDEKAALLAQADIYVLPSIAEGMPRGLIEAMAVGLPVISTKVGGIPDFITHGENGLLVATGDVDGLVDNIVRLANDHKLRSLMRHANIQKVNSTLLQENVFNAYKHLYNTLLSAE
jgi:glycosyltransferase involved in cell wall biosynthesis